MAAQQISFTIDWGVWIPITIALLALFMNFLQMRKKNSRDSMHDMEKRIDEANDALKECERNLVQCGREKDELRREKFALLEQIASMAKPKARDSSDDGGES